MVPLHGVRSGLPREAGPKITQRTEGLIDGPRDDSVGYSVEGNGGTHASGEREGLGLTLKSVFGSVYSSTCCLPARIVHAEFISIPQCPRTLTCIPGLCPCRPPTSGVLGQVRRVRLHGLRGAEKTSTWRLELVRPFDLCLFFPFFSECKTEDGPSDCLKRPTKREKTTRHLRSLESLDLKGHW